MSDTPRPPIVVPNRTEAPKEVPLPPAPKIATTTPVAKEPPVNVVVTAPPPAPPPVKKTPTRRARRGTKKAAEVKIAEAPKPESPKPDGAKVDGPQAEEAKPAAQAVKLGVILTPEQTRELAKRLEEAVDRTKSAVVLIEGKLLTKDQTETLGRIRSFLAQAEQTREEDLAGSVSLAERADLLSRDLLERLR
ncbi:MAG: hypothetical protein JNL62_16515, partial [Bryobacterales bacterium]|nr:hypothetical protein [Bryobacterales bacterium]